MKISELIKRLQEIQQEDFHAQDIPVCISDDDYHNRTIENFIVEKASAMTQHESGMEHTMCIVVGRWAEPVTVEQQLKFAKDGSKFYRGKP